MAVLISILACALVPIFVCIAAGSRIGDGDRLGADPCVAMLGS
jgi:hypothetical protein